MRTIHILTVLAALAGPLGAPLAAGDAKFHTVYRFDTGAGGAPPNGLVESGGVFYGTTQGGGTYYDGTVFSLKPPTNRAGNWTETVLHNFDSQAGDGGQPYAPPVVGPGGVLYGTTGYGGAYCNEQTPLGCGTVYQMVPPSTPGGAWTESVLFSFNYGAPGRGPQSELIPCSDPSVCTAGAIYGTTAAGGIYAYGTVFELQPPASPGGAWAETVLYSFTGGNDGNGPYGLTMSANGTLYGVTAAGGTDGGGGAGTVFELTPPAMPGGAWTETVLHSFLGGRDGSAPYEAPLIAADGTLYGNTYGACEKLCSIPYGVGTVFALRPPATPGGTWAKRILHDFGGASPDSPLAFRGGAVYGTFSLPPGNGGCIFKLQHGSGGKWEETVLHTFPDNVNPFGNFVMSKKGTIVGTAINSVPKNDHPTDSAYSLRP